MKKARVDAQEHSGFFLLLAHGWHDGALCIPADGISGNAPSPTQLLLFFGCRMMASLLVDSPAFATGTFISD